MTKKNRKTDDKQQEQATDGKMTNIYISMYGDNIKMTRMTVNRIKHKEVLDHNLFKTKSDIILLQKDRD